MLLNIDINRKVQMNISKLTLTLLLCLSVSSVVASDSGTASSRGRSGNSGSHNLSVNADVSGSGAAAASSVLDDASGKKDGDKSGSNSKAKRPLLRMPKFKIPKFAKSGLRKLVRPSVVSAAITYVTRAAYNKSNFVESNNKVLGYGIVGTASILLAVKKARKWLNSSEEAVEDVVRAAAVATTNIHSAATANAISRDSVSVSGSSLPPVAAAAAYPADNSSSAAVAVGVALPPYHVPAPSYPCEPRPLRRDASMFDLAHVGEAAIGVNSDLLEALVGIGAGILAPMPSFLK